MKTSLFSLLCILCILPRFARGDDPLSESEKRHHTQLTGSLPLAKSVELFYGTPRRYGKWELPSERVILLGDFEFYAASKTLSADVGKKITALVSDPASHGSYSGMKLCGGFHPDFCIIWRFEKDGQPWETKLFICMSCHEWRMIDTLSALQDEIRPTAFAAIKALFPKK